MINRAVHRCEQVNLYPLSCSYLVRSKLAGRPERLTTDVKGPFSSEGTLYCPLHGSALWHVCVNAFLLEHYHFLLVVFWRPLATFAHRTSGRMPDRLAIALADSCQVASCSAAPCAWEYVGGCGGGSKQTWTCRLTDPRYMLIPHVANQSSQMRRLLRQR